MRPSQLKRIIGLTFTATGILACGAAIFLQAAAISDATRLSLVIYGITATLVPAVTGMLRRTGSRPKASLAHRENTLARWTLDSATWTHFVYLNEELSAIPGALRNELRVFQHAPNETVEVIVGHSAIEVDGSVHNLKGREITNCQLLGGALLYIEIDLYFPDDDSPIRTTLRFPVAPGSRGDAQRVVTHYASGRATPPGFFHGKGDGSNPEDLSTCWSCGYETFRLASVCPQCGSSLQSRRWSRRFGAVVSLLSLFITGVMGAVLYFTLPMLLHPGVKVNGSTFAGSAAQAFFVLALLTSVLMFGLIMTTYGVWQMITGKRDIRVLKVLLYLGAAFGVSLLGMFLAEHLHLHL